MNKKVLETPEQYARRTLYDLANILDNLDKENWERDQKIIVKALQTHSSVLRRIAERIGPFS